MMLEKKNVIFFVSVADDRRGVDLIAETIEKDYPEYLPMVFDESAYADDKTHKFSVALDRAFQKVFRKIRRAQTQIFRKTRNGKFDIQKKTFRRIQAHSQHNSKVRSRDGGCNDAETSESLRSGQQKAQKTNQSGGALPRFFRRHHVLF